VRTEVGASVQTAEMFDLTDCAVSPILDPHGQPFSFSWSASVVGPSSFSCNPHASGGAQFVSQGWELSADSTSATVRQGVFVFHGDALAVAPGTQSATVPTNNRTLQPVFPAWWLHDPPCGSFDHSQSAS
jgi:hypothetical protein